MESEAAGSFGCVRAVWGCVLQKEECATPPPAAALIKRIAEATQNQTPPLNVIKTLEYSTTLK